MVWWCWLLVCWWLVRALEVGEVSLVCKSLLLVSAVLVEVCNCRVVAGDGLVVVVWRWWLLVSDALVVVGDALLVLGEDLVVVIDGLGAMKKGFVVLGYGLVVVGNVRMVEGDGFVAVGNILVALGVGSVVVGDESVWWALMWWHGMIVPWLCLMVWKRLVTLRSPWVRSVVEWVMVMIFLMAAESLVVVN